MIVALSVSTLALCVAGFIRGAYCGIAAVGVALGFTARKEDG
ncbi:MAG: hypothetical protein OXC11_14360 [Rhodospirillales bacterium]|nr:hypothetical protein [Rhodospirillales bacterium]